MASVSVVAWGRTSAGQLGLGGIEETTITQPRSLRTLQRDRVRVQQMACGHAHTLLLTESGDVMSCGSNEKGQCGQETSSTRPSYIDRLCGPAITVTHVSCGHSHSMAMTAEGLLYCWGSNEHGQLGVSSSSLSHLAQPQVLEDVSKMKVLQVACGGHHTLALVSGGRLFSWGSNMYGQLGLRATVLSLSTPLEVKALLGLPVLHIAAGDAHSMVVSQSGAVYGWGRNTFGQLGVGHERDTSAPTELATLRTHRVRYISCGETHSAALTEDGGLFTFGSSSYGQLGHNANTSHSTTYPTKVFELMGSTVTQVACGRCHTLALVQSSGRVYAWGLGSSGQLGMGTTANVATPTLVKGHWQSGDTLPPAVSPQRVRVLEEIVGTRQEQLADTQRDHHQELGEVEGTRGDQEGGEGETRLHRGEEKEEGEGEREDEEKEMEVDVPEGEVMGATGRSGEGRGQDEEGLVMAEPAEGMVVRGVFAGGDQSFASLISPGEQDMSVMLDCRHKNVSCLPPPMAYDSLKKLLDEALITKNYSQALSFLKALFSRPSLLNSSFLASGHHQIYTYGAGVDLEEALRTMSLLRQRLAQATTDIQKTVQSSLVEMLRQMASQKLVSSECVRLYHVLPAFILQPLDTSLFAVFAYSLTSLGAEWKALIGRWLYESPLHYLQLWLESAKESIKQNILSRRPDTAKHKNLIEYSTALNQSALDMQNMLKLMKCIHEWNTRHGEVLAHSEFYVPCINDFVDFVEEFFNWINPKDCEVVFCQFPFLLDSRAKAELIKVESRVQMHIAVNSAQTDYVRRLFTQQMIHDFSPMAFKLTVDRSNLVQDTLNSLVSTDHQNFKKPLQVEFVGEEGMDAGGVQKEFFMLLLRDMLNPEFGMFQEDEESHFIWFSDEPLLYGSLNHFTLVGIVCGLAIYNSVIIDLPFPTALYKKILKKPTDLSDLKQLHPSVGANLESLLTYEGDDFEDTFTLTFELTRSSFGEVMTVPLIPGGSSVPVTLDNRTEYVRAYVKHVLDDCVREPFTAFEEGFRRVCDGKVLALLHPQELMSLVVGQQDIDWTHLEKYMDYKNGYHKDHAIIKLFWSVFYDLPLEAKKKFLVFWTGSNRIPVAGVESMKMMIQRMDGGRNCERLPVAHTCFNVLDLPPYNTYEHMKEKILQAIHFTAGFGIV